MRRAEKYYPNIIADNVGKEERRADCITKLLNQWIGQKKAKAVVGSYYAAFHRSQNNLVESVGCKVIFLLPCSPGLNPIRKFWAKDVLRIKYLKNL